MPPLLIAAGVGFLIGLIIVGVPVIILSRAKTKAFKSACDAYERIIARSDEQLAAARDSLTAFMDRWYGAKNLPPQDVDMAALHEKREQREEERRVERKNGGALPPRIGEPDRLVREMELGILSGKYLQPK